MEQTPKSGKSTRAKHACRECNSRRVRCDVTEQHPCSNCRASSAVCEVHPSRRGRYPRKSKSSVSQSREAVAARTLQEFADPSNSASLPAPPTASASQSSPSAYQDHLSPIPTSTPVVPPTVQTGNRYYGESNFLSLVPRQPDAAGREQLSPSTWRSTSQMTFPIPPTPQSAGASATTATPQSMGLMSASTERYLRDEGALKWPDPASSLPALEAYFTWFHPCFPILDQGDVRRRVMSGEISPILMQAILFTAATYCNEETIFALGFQDRLEAKSVLYTRARLLFHADIEKDGSILVQALFLLSFWRGGPSDTRDVRYWLGVAITLAESLGYHRSARFTTHNLHNAKMRRRMWWSIYVRERQAAASLGLPSRIRDEDCDIEPLQSSDLTSEASPELGFVPLTQEHVMYAIKMVEISRLLGKIIDLYFTPGRRTAVTEQVESLSLSLDDWKASLPHSLKWDVDEVSPSIWRYLLHLAYNHLTILIHRNSFLRHTNGAEKDIVIRSASRISRIAEDMLSHKVLQYGQMHMITSFFTALCVHAISLRTATGLEKTITSHRAQMCLMGLKEIQKYWKINNNLLDLFLNYLDESIARRLHGDGPGAPDHPIPDTHPAPELDLSVTDGGGQHFEGAEERLEDSLGAFPMFQPYLGGVGDTMFDLRMFLDPDGTLDDEMQLEGFNSLQRVL